MCRLDFLPVQQQADPGPISALDEEDAALEALLSLSAHSTAAVGAGELPGITQQQQQQPHQDSSLQSDSRYYCPFPSCKRSFAELWRLKVHYRAPPNIRGSGKERGHGMRLTHCPKCGAALKVGGHHVKCAAVSKEPGGVAVSNTSRRNRKAAAAASRPEFEPTDMHAAMAAAVPAYDSPGAQQHQQQQLAFSTAAAAAAGSGRLSAYAQYGMTGMLPQEQGDAQTLAQRAAAFLQQQQQQQQQGSQHMEDYTEDCTSAGVAGPAHPTSTPGGKPDLASAAAAATAAAATGVSLQRLASSDDSSNSRLIGACSSGGAGIGSGYDNSWGPSSSSCGSGSGSDEPVYQQQQVQQLLQPPAYVAAHTAAAADAAAAPQLPPAVKLESPAEQQQAQQLQQQHPQAGQLLWQHMLLQHLQQHVQQAPGFSLPELISVAAALFGNKVDTLVTAFGVTGAAAGGSSGSSTHAQMAQLVSSLKQADNSSEAPPAAAAAAGGSAAPVYFPQ